MKLYFLLIFVIFAFLATLAGVSASCCVFDDEEVYFELGTWDKASTFCTNIEATYSVADCSSLDGIEDLCDGWTDCNTEVVPPVFSGSSHSRSRETREVTCTEYWDCTEWSTCTNDEKQTRYCVDLNSCGTDYSKPLDIVGCDYVEEVISEENNEDNEETNNGEGLGDITGAAVNVPQTSKIFGGILFSVIVIGGLTLYFLKRKKRELKK